jgi:hypothetical protein
MENQQPRKLESNGPRPVIHLKQHGPAPPANPRRAPASQLPILRRDALAATHDPHSKNLSPPECRQRDECETIIAKGWDTFIEVGHALLTIRNQRLYRDQYARFEDYCLQKWEYSKTHANRLIDAAAVAGILTPIGVKVQSESQLRPLLALSPKQIPAAWKRAEELAGGAQVTAKIVRRAVEDFKTGPGPDSLGGPKHLGEGSPLPAPCSKLRGRSPTNSALKLIEKIEKAARTNDLGTILAALKILRKHLRDTSH